MFAIEKGAAMLSRFANPARFMRVSGAVLPWLGAAAAGVLARGLVWSLLIAPPAYQPGESGRGAGSLLAVVGVVNLPIIKFSVDWWNTLHQPASVLRMGGPSIDASLLIPLLVMAVGFALLFLWLLLLRMRTQLNEKKARAL